MKKRLLSICTAAMLILTLAACGTPADKGTSGSGTNADTGAIKYTVGILQQLEHPALDAATEGFKEALTEKLGDSVKFDEANAQNDMNNCTTIANKFVSDGVDLIMANATTALQAAAAATDKIPVVGTARTDHNSAGVLKGTVEKPGGNVTGASDLAPLDQQAELFTELLPNVKKVGILYCSSEPNSKFQADKMEELLNAKQIEVKIFTVADSNEIQNVLTAAVEEIEALYIPTDNTIADNTELIKNITLNAKIPVITGEENQCKVCGLATLSISYKDMGYSAGLVAADILQGKANPADTAIVYSKEVTKLFNPEIAKQLGIEIPEGIKAIGE